MTARSKNPLISVVLPTRNAGALLGVAVHSILTQTEPDFELIIIDDRSEDGSTDGIHSLDSRIRVIRNDGRGLVAALNTGLRCARGEWIARMDGDDIALPMRFSSQLALATESPDISIVGAKVDIFSDTKTIDEGYRSYEHWINSLVSWRDIRREIFVESPIPHPSAFFRRRVIDRIGPYREGDFPEDYDLFLRANAAGFRMGKPDAVLLRWRDDVDRTSRVDPRYAFGNFLKLKCEALANDDRLANGITIWGAGRGGRQLFDALSVHGIAVNGFVDVHPRRIGNKVRNKPVYAIDDVGQIGDFIVVAVGARNVRNEIRGALAKHNKREETDYLFAM